MKGLLVTLVVLAGLLVGADLVAVRVAEDRIAEQVQRSAALDAPPEVDVRGYPFLTQALAGRYEEVRLRTSGDVGGTRLAALELVLRGVRLPLSDALSGAVGALPVDGLTGRVLVSYDELSRQAGRGLRVSPAGDRLRVQGSVEVLGQQLSAAAVSEVALADGALVVRAQEFETGSGVADRLLARAIGDRFDVRVPVEGLPFDLQLQDVQVRPDGVLLSAAAGPTVLQAQESAGAARG